MVDKDDIRWNRCKPERHIGLYVVIAILSLIIAFMLGSMSS